MAEEVQIPGAQSTAKIRNPLAVIGLAIITLGIYAIFWYYFINREMADLGRARGTTELGESPATSVVAITLGALVIVPALFSIYYTCKRVETASRMSGNPDPLAAGLLFVLYIFIAPVALYLVQDTLNKAWQAQAAGHLGEGGQAPVPAAPERPVQAPTQP